jgi:hypothetical protein
MTPRFEDFVGIYDNFMSAEFCQAIIDRFAYAEANGYTQTRKVAEKASSVEKQDTALFTADSIDGDLVHQQNRTFLQEFWAEAYPAYVDKYGILNNFETHRVYHTKVQRTRPSEGYHVWHCEDSSREYNSRIMAYILYLNDIAEGGETEFLYYGKRIKPETGKLVLFPAGYTHAHRGNPPLNETKYILTGWVEL